VKNIHFLEIVPQIRPLIGTENPQSQTENCPEMNHRIVPTIMLAQLVNLGMTVVTSGNTVICTGCLDLFVLDPPKLKTLILKPSLQKSTTPATAIIVGSIGSHVYEIFLPYACLDGISKIFSNGIPKALPYNLARVLKRKLDPKLLVPV
jgi:hypothetical protein